MLFYTQDKTIDDHFFTIFISSMSHKINIYNFYSKLQNKKKKKGKSPHQRHDTKFGYVIC